MHDLRHICDEEHLLDCSAQKITPWIFIYLFICVFRILLLYFCLVVVYFVAQEWFALNSFLTHISFKALNVYLQTVHKIL